MLYKTALFAVRKHVHALCSMGSNVMHTAPVQPCKCHPGLFFTNLAALLFMLLLLLLLCYACVVAELHCPMEMKAKDARMTKSTKTPNLVALGLPCTVKYLASTNMPQQAIEQLLTGDATDKVWDSTVQHTSTTVLVCT